jgi:hypothetical protein
MPTVILTLECCDLAILDALVKRIHALLPTCTSLHNDRTETPHRDMATVIRDLLACQTLFFEGDDTTFRVLLASNWMRCAARKELYHDMVCQTAASLLSSPTFQWTTKHLVVYLELPLHETFEHTMHDPNRHDMDFVSDVEMEGCMRQWMKSPARRLLPCPTLKHTVKVPSCASDNVADILTLTDTIVDILHSTCGGLFT